MPTVARTCPAVTAWPACTSTAVTVPETPKSRSAWVAGSSVPEVATVCLIVPVVTLTVSDEMTRPVAGDPPVNARVSPVARPAIRMTAAPIRRNLRLRRRPSGAAGSPPGRGGVLGSEDHGVGIARRSIVFARARHDISRSIRCQGQPSIGCECAWSFLSGLIRNIQLTAHWSPATTRRPHPARTDSQEAHSGHRPDP